MTCNCRQSINDEVSAATVNSFTQSSKDDESFRDCIDDVVDSSLLGELKASSQLLIKASR